MQDLTSLILCIIENPLAEKGYRDLKKYYESNNMLNEAEALGELIAKRFHENNNTLTDQEQQ